MFNVGRMKDLKYSYEMPTRVEFGAGIIATVADEAKKLNMSKIMLVSDKGVVKAGLTKVVEQKLKESNIEYILHDDVVPNPRDVDMDAAGELAKKENVDGIIAIGGGSAMDTAKAVGTLVTNGGKVLDWCGVYMLNKPMLPMIAIPTTAGTGSEVTFFAVVTNTKEHVKCSIWDSKAAPKVALCDPELLIGLPPHVKASTGIDALVHAVEAYTCKASMPHTDAVALLAIELIFKHLRDYITNPNIDNCSHILTASNLAGIAIGSADVAGVHCIAEALGGKYDIPHGVANAMLLGTVSKFNCRKNPEKYARVAQAIGIDVRELTVEKAAMRGVDEMVKLCDEIGIKHMSEFDVIKPDDFEVIAEAAQNNTSTGSNPVETTKEFYLEVIKEAYFG